MGRYLYFVIFVTTALVYKAKVESLGSSLLHDESRRFMPSAKPAELCDQLGRPKVYPFFNKDVDM